MWITVPMARTQAPPLVDETLDQVGEGFAEVDAGNAVKPVIVPDEV
ncbi:hypothetical protein ACLFMI_06005 [Pseudonocardia nantongensis]